MYKTEWLPTAPPPPEVRRESGKGGGLRSDVSCTKAHAKVRHPCPYPGILPLLGVQEEGLPRRAGFCSDLAEGTEMQPLISPLGQFEGTPGHPKSSLWASTFAC